MSLLDDLEAATGKRSWRRVPAAFLLNPGFGAVVLYRASAALARGSLPSRILSKIFWRLNIHFFACHVHPKSVIGPGLALPHPCGVVVGEDARIGAHVALYQNVTLGSSPRDGIARYPVIGDRVTIYPNSVVIGAIKVGDGAIVGAMSLVNRDVPADAVVGGVPAVPIGSRPSTAGSPS